MPVKKKTNAKKTAFDRIIGYDSVKEKLRNYADCLAHPEKYEELGAAIPAGVLFYGDPGLGKTLMAKCLMEESGRIAYIIRKNYSDGDFINEMRTIVEEAAQNAPSIVLFDDMDKYANEDYMHKDAEEYVAIQALIDQYSPQGVFFVATVNEIDDFPASLLRAGRFDCLIELLKPHPRDSERILSYYLKRRKLSDDIDIELVSRMMGGKSCADMETIVNEACLHAAFKGKKKVDQESIMYACLKELYCDDAFEIDELAESKWENMHESAVHEVGHAVVSEFMNQGSVNLITIMKSDNRSVKGVTSGRNAGKVNEEWKIRERILTALGGKAATEVVLGRIDTGCECDIKDAASWVTKLVENYNQYGFHTGWQKRYGENEWCKENRDKIVAFELERYYMLAKEIICNNREFFDTLVKELEEKKILTFRDIQRIRENLNKVEA